MVPLFVFGGTDHVRTRSLVKKLSAHRVIGGVGSGRVQRWLETLACAAIGPYFSNPSMQARRFIRPCMHMHVDMTMRLARQHRWLDGENLVVNHKRLEFKGGDAVL